MRVSSSPWMYHVAVFYPDLSFLDLRSPLRSPAAKINAVWLHGHAVSQVTQLWALREDGNRLPVQTRHALWSRFEKNCFLLGVSGQRYCSVGMISALFFYARSMQLFWVLCRVFGFSSPCMEGSARSFHVRNLSSRPFVIPGNYTCLRGIKGTALSSAPVECQWIPPRHLGEWAMKSADEIALQAFLSDDILEDPFCLNELLRHVYSRSWGIGSYHLPYWV